MLSSQGYDVSSVSEKNEMKSSEECEIFLCIFTACEKNLRCEFLPFLDEI